VGQSLKLGIPSLFLFTKSVKNKGISFQKVIEEIDSP
jgi:hypothetical protein